MRTLETETLFTFLDHAKHVQYYGNSPNVLWGSGGGHFAVPANLVVIPIHVAHFP